MSPWKALLVFLAYILTDVAWARYTLNVAARRSVKSAIDSCFIVLTGAVAVVAYQDSVWYVIPACLGAALATFWVVKHSKE